MSDNIESLTVENLAFSYLAFQMHLDDNDKIPASMGSLGNWESWIHGLSVEAISQFVL